jgi:hypothetical protein
VLRDPTHPEHEEMRTWAGPDYEPERFDLARANTKLGALSCFFRRLALAAKDTSADRIRLNATTLAGSSSSQFRTQLQWSGASVLAV